MKNYNEFNKDQKIKYWSEHISRWEESGLSQKKYCEHEGLSYWSFRTWYYKTRAESTGIKFIKMTVPKPGERSSAEITITLSRKIRIEFKEDISEETLRKIFRAAEVLND